MSKYIGDFLPTVGSDGYADFINRVPISDDCTDLSVVGSTDWQGLDADAFPALSEAVAGKSYLETLKWMFEHPEQAEEIQVPIGIGSYPAFGVRNLFTNDIMSTKFYNIFARHLFFRYGINVEDFRPYYSLGYLKSGFTVAINEADMFCEAEIKASEMFASHQRSNSCCDMDVEVNDQILEIDESLILDKTLVNPPSTHATLVNLNLCSTDQAVVKPGTSTCVDVHSEYHSILTQCKEVCTQPFVDKFDPNPRIVRQLALEFGSITTDGIRYRFYRAMAVGFDIFVQAHKLDRDMALRFVANDWVAYKHSFKVSSFLAGK